MNDQFRIPDRETRTKSIANLKAASRLLDKSNLDQDDAIALVEKDLRAQYRARLLHGKNSMLT